MTADVLPTVEALGYSRYWFTDHPPQPDPHVFAALAAGLTERIRVGAGAICLRYRRPLQVALDLLFLEDMFPGRVDAGFCPGGPARIEGLEDSAAESYADRVDRLVGLLRGTSPVTLDDGRSIPPEGVEPPEIWSMGGAGSADLAAQHGTAFAYSLFHSHSERTAAHCQRYRRSFRRVGALADPYVAVAVAGVCAPTEEEARRLEAAHTNRFIVPTVVGSPDRCAELLASLCKDFEMDEIVFLDICEDVDDRIRSLELFRTACQHAGES